MSILVVGGAGYIGSHMVKQLATSGVDVVTIDNLSCGYRDAVKYGEFVEGDLGDPAVLDHVFDNYSVDAVMHFAAFIEVGESVSDPAKYYRNNVLNTMALLDAMIQHGIQHFIFSSTAAIFGEPEYTPIDEKHAKQPINPYGRSKLMVEQILQDYDSAYELKSTCLRYFNAAGADPDGELGERHDPESHLIPLILQAASGRREDIKVFGTDYPTEDGTCVRDYIHINDLCKAHSLALKHMQQTGRSARYNLGNGRGFSVQQVIDTTREVTGRDFKVTRTERRPGDPAVLVADSERARRELGWQPDHNDLESIITTAWSWETGFLSKQE
ncbi:MAG: UDP-glucose 4-epimerase GalE [Gammaproteobacteria bacterium]|nr:UDP-glucose 4-epimerase GalE [Gammaproteobacteria bacterium]NNL06883.1 UDP-glucose 4-epimerase GalE [Gammaproteobacteria bacterium]